jgi:hypothetical protein
VIHDFRPELDAVAKELGLDVLDRTEIEEELVVVLVWKIEAR